VGAAASSTADVGGRLVTPGIGAHMVRTPVKGEAGTGLGHRHVGSGPHLRRNCAIWSTWASVIARMWPAVAQACPLVPLIDVHTGRASRRRSCHAGGPA
jgi:hypothetical protein